MKNLLTKCYIESKLTLEQFKENQQGVTAIEYALIAIAVAAAIGAAMVLFGPQIEAAFQNLTTRLTAAAATT